MFQLQINEEIVNQNLPSEESDNYADQATQSDVTFTFSTPNQNKTTKTPESEQCESFFSESMAIE